MDLHGDTLRLLKNTTVSNPEIEDDLGISVDWLYRFKQGLCVNPNYQKVECLHDYLLREHKHRLKQNRKCSERAKK
jgi:hypothetical protein